MHPLYDFADVFISETSSPVVTDCLNPPPTVPNSVVNVKTDEHGTIAWYSCVPGSRLAGGGVSASVVCVDRSWPALNLLPMCQGAINSYFISCCVVPHYLAFASKYVLMTINFTLRPYIYIYNITLA